MLRLSAIFNKEKISMSVNKIQQAMIIFSLLFLTLSINACGKQDPAHQIPVVQKGILDLRDWDFEKNGPVNLDGEWDFYPNRLLLPGEFQGKENNRKGAGYIKVPGNWKTFPTDKGQFGTIGHGTYRLKIITGVKQRYQVYLKRIFSAYNFYVNQELVLKNGIVSADERSKLLLQKRIIEVPESNNFDLVLQVSNYDHSTRAGILDKISFGLKEQILREQKNMIIMELFNLSALIILGFYFMTVYILIPREKASLYLFLSCIGNVIRLFAAGGYLNYIYPEVDGELNYRIYVISTYLSIIITFTVVHILFPEIRWKLIIIIIFLCPVIPVFVFLPLRYSTIFIPVFNILLMTALVLTMVSIFMALRNRRTGSIIFLVTVATAIFLAVYTILRGMGFINISLDPGSIYAVVIAFSFGVIITRRFAKSFTTVEKLSDELGDLNKNLEHKIEDRTKDLETAKVKAENANRAKSAFLANMSHELRTPLNAILGFSQLTTRDPQLKVSTKENLSIINRSGEHLLDLINSVLEMSKIEAGMDTLIEKGFDLYNTLDDIKSLMRNRSDKKGLKLVFECDSKVSQYIKTDENKLRQVLINFLGNAVKFTSIGQVTLRVTQSQEPDSDINTGRVTLNFEIEDTGPGIPEEDIENIFKPFTQSNKDRNKAEGTGLGLSISRELAKQLGGEIFVKSKVGSGSTFSFYITAFVVKEDEIEVTKPSRTVIGIKDGSAAPDEAPFRILVVDDKYENRILLCKLLRQTGFEVKEAINGNQGVEMTIDWRPHLIWMDIRMPVMDGYEAVEEIRSRTVDTESINPKIIALTASAFEEEKVKVLSKGFDDFVRKPFKIDKIFEKMAEHIGVKYVYEEADGGRKPAEYEKLSDEELNSGIKALPSETVSELLEAAELSDVGLVEEVISRIRPQNSGLADALQRFAGDYAFNKIIGAVRESKGITT